MRKPDEIASFLNDSNSDIALTETQLTPDITNNEIILRNNAYIYMKDWMKKYSFALYFSESNAWRCPEGVLESSDMIRSHPICALVTHTNHIDNGPLQSAEPPCPKPIGRMDRLEHDGQAIAPLMAGLHGSTVTPRAVSATANRSTKHTLH